MSRRHGRPQAPAPRHAGASAGIPVAQLLWIGLLLVTNSQPVSGRGSARREPVGLCVRGAGRGAQGSRLGCRHRVNAVRAASRANMGGLAAAVRWLSRIERQDSRCAHAPTQRANSRVKSGHLLAGAGEPTAALTMAAIAQAAATAALKPSLKTVSNWTCRCQRQRAPSAPQPALTRAGSPPPCLQRAARSRTVQVKAVASVEQAAAAGVKVRLQPSRGRRQRQRQQPVAPGARLNSEWLSEAAAGCNQNPRQQPFQSCWGLRCCGCCQPRSFARCHAPSCGCSCGHERSCTLNARHMLLPLCLPACLRAELR